MKALAVTMLLLCGFCANSYSQLSKNTIEAKRHLVKDLLIHERAMRQQSLMTQQNTIVQARIFLAVIFATLIASMFNRDVEPRGKKLLAVRI